MLPEIARHTEKLFYFFEIANTGNLRATARKLGLTPPTLTYSLKRLEEVVGAPLLERSQSGVELTDAGEKLMVFCRRYYRELEEVQRLIDQPSQKILTHIKIGTFQSIAMYFWPILLKKLRQDPQFSISIMTNRSKTVLEALIKREIDMALTVETIKHGNLINHELYKDEYNFYISKKKHIAKIKTSDLPNYDILYIPDAVDRFGKSLRQYLHGWDLSFKEEFELDSLEVIVEFVRRGYGIGILPTRVAKAYVKSLKPVRIEGGPNGAFGTHRFFLSYRDDLELNQHLMNSLLESARKAVMELNS